MRRPVFAALSACLFFAACGGGGDDGGPPAPMAVRLAIVQSPQGGVSGAALTTQPVLEIQDANGVRVSNATNAVTVTASGPGALTGTTTVNAVGGLATFSGLVVTGAGVTNLSFSATGLTGASAAVTTALPFVASLAVTGAPSVVTFGATLPAVAVELRGSNGARLSDDTRAVTVRVKPATAGGSPGTRIAGTRTIAAAAGVATFTDLALFGGTSATLEFTVDGTETTGATAPIAITPLILPIDTAFVGQIATASQVDIYSALAPADTIGLSLIAGKRVTAQSLDAEFEVDVGGRTFGGSFDEFSDGSEWRAIVSEGAGPITLRVGGVGATTGEYDLFNAACDVVDGRDSATVSTALDAEDCLVPTVSDFGLASGAFVRFRGTSGSPVTVTLAGSTPDFDTVLILFGPRGDLILVNDDAAQGQLFSRVTFTPELTGDYIAIATTFDNGAFGPVTLTFAPGGSTDGVRAGAATVVPSFRSIDAARRATDVKRRPR